MLYDGISGWEVGFLYGSAWPVYEWEGDLLSM